MKVDTELLVPMTEANQNFSKVTRMVDENGLAVILKNNKPRYIVIDFEDYDLINQARKLREKKISQLADKLIDENLIAFKELAK